MKNRGLNPFVLFFFLVLGLCLSNPGFSQNGTGRLVGRILDESGNEPLFGAVVMVTGTQKGATADFDGNFMLPLPEGTYEVSFKLLGYQTRQYSAIKIKAGENTPLTVYLRQMAKDVKEVEVVEIGRAHV